MDKSGTPAFKLQYAEWSRTCKPMKYNITCLNPSISTGSLCLVKARYIGIRDTSLARGRMRIVRKLIKKWMHWKCGLNKHWTDMKKHNINSPDDIPGFADLQTQDKRSVQAQWRALDQVQPGASTPATPRQVGQPSPSPGRGVVTGFSLTPESTIGDGCSIRVSSSTKRRRTDQETRPVENSFRSQRPRRGE